MPHYPTSDNIHLIRVIFTFLILKKEKKIMEYSLCHELCGMQKSKQQTVIHETENEMLQGK